MPQTTSYIDSLKEKQYLAIIKSNEYKALLSDMCERIVVKSKTAPNEATIESYFDCELFSFFRQVFAPLGFEYNPTKEAAISTERHVAKGRADTVVGTLVVEFKQPSTLSNGDFQEKAVLQISDYLEGLKLETSLVGFVTDGVKGCFVTYNDGKLTTEEFQSLSFKHLDRLIKNIIGLKLTALTSHNLVESFCNPPYNNGMAFALAKELYRNLTDRMSSKTKMLFNEWKELFNLSHDDASKQQAIIDRRKSLEGILNISFNEADEEYMALFALQTAYVIIIKMVAYRIVSIVKYNASLISFESLVDIGSDALRQQLASLEEGAIFRSYGITNLLEGDFFSWYSDTEQWRPQIAKLIVSILKILSVYSDKPVLNVEKKSTDFFKELYQAMMPTAVRHSLGEYYTRRWIAQQVFDEALKLARVEKWKGIDPCCGSGTFITIMIDKVLEETVGQCDKKRLKEVLTRVKGVDLNPIAVLTARVNYFINIANLVSNQEELEIPIYLGDSSYVPRRVRYDGVECLEYTINTLISPIQVLMPVSMFKDQNFFSKTMTGIEAFIRNLDETGTYRHLASLVSKKDLTEKIKKQIHKLASTLVDLERRHWDGIWARIITNYLTTANLGKFDVIVGNPPWIDWKSLPSGYRDRIKSLCISRKLFSGDKVTGGINLNICALISNVVAENWLADDGILGFLMPEPLIFQPSYEGFRDLYLADNTRLYIKKITNWTRAGHPFKPVMQKFLTYYFSREKIDYRDGIDVDWLVLKSGKNYGLSEDINLNEYFDKKTTIAATCHESKNMFSYIDSRKQLKDFMSIAGQCSYVGREGIEFYPQEMMIFTTSNLPSTKTCTSLQNIQVKKPKYHVPPKPELLETEYLHPLIKGVDISPFHVEASGLIVPFPYNNIQNDRLPIPMDELIKSAPKLAEFYQRHRDLILSQTTYNERIIGRKGEFYALARVGAYSFAENYVAFRDNTKWGAAVVTTLNTPWGGRKHPLFQNHAVSICEDIDGRFITYDEAHFICGILNSPVTFDYVLNSSDSRSFPIRPRIYIPKYDETNKIHQEISNLSKEAHQKFNNKTDIDKILKRLNELYLKLAQNQNL